MIAINDDLLGEVDRALLALDTRRDEDVDAWAEELARDFAECDE